MLNNICNIILRFLSFLIKSFLIQFKANEIESQGYLGNWGILKAKANIISYTNELKKHGKNTKHAKNIVGVNIRPNIEAEELTPYLCDIDYEYCAKEILECADYIVLNIADAKNEGIKQFYSEQNLKSLIEKIKDILYLNVGLSKALEIESLIEKKHVEPIPVGVTPGQNIVNIGIKENQSPKFVSDFYEATLKEYKAYTPLILLKIDSNISEVEQKTIAKVALESGIDGLVIGSMGTNNMNEFTAKKFKYKNGAILNQAADDALKKMYQLTKG